MLRFLIWLDQRIFWIATLGNCHPSETISAAAYRGEQQGRLIAKIARPCIDFLLQWWGPQPHCKQAYLWQRDIYGE